MSRYTLTDTARRDINDIWNYVAADNLTAADRLIDRFFARFRRLADQPLSGAIFPQLAPTIRYCVVGRYVIFYQPHGSGVRIVRVLHGARDFSTLFKDEPIDDL